MGRIKFWADKIHYMIYFAWNGLWWAVWDEWKMTHQEYLHVQEHSEEICREAEERLLKAIREEEDKRV
jgi:hypothetical protein